MYNYVYAAVVDDVLLVSLCLPHLVTSPNLQSIFYAYKIQLCTGAVELTETERLDCGAVAYNAPRFSIHFRYSTLYMDGELVSTNVENVVESILPKTLTGSEIHTRETVSVPFLGKSISSKQYIHEIYSVIHADCAAIKSSDS